MGHSKDDYFAGIVQVTGATPSDEAVRRAVLPGVSLT